MVIARDERGWRIRERADRRGTRAGMAVAPLVIVASGTALLWPVIPAGPGVAIAATVTVVLTVAMLALFKPGGTSLVDTVAHNVTLPDGTVVTFGTVGGVAFDTTTEITGGRRQMSQRQIWCVRLLDRRRRVVSTVATHAREYALYPAATRLAEELRVPLFDDCGGRDDVALFEPGARFYDAPPPRPGEQPPADAGRLDAGPGGVGLWWRTRRTDAIVGLVVSVAITALALRYAAVSEDFAQAVGRAVGVAFSLLFVVVCARGAQVHGRTTLTLLGDKLRLRLPFPFAHGPDVPWRSIERVRLSRQLSRIAPRAGDARPAPKVLVLDVLVGGRPRFRAALATAQARWIYEQLRAGAPEERNATRQ